MTRIKRRRRKRNLTKSSGIKSFQYSFFDRRSRKRFFRSLWICRINAQQRQYGLNYAFSAPQSILNRKIFTQLKLYDTKKPGALRAPLSLL